MNVPIIEMYKCLQQEGKLTGIPHLLIRFTGCTHRCQFAENDWCDTWYTSIHPQKGKYSFNEVKDRIKNYKGEYIMITGGSPSMHKHILTQLLNFCYDMGKHITIETECSHAIESTYKVDLISISPKFSNSVPLLNTLTPLNKIVDAKLINTHNKYRQNRDAIKNALYNHVDYQFKPVCDGSDFNWNEIELFIQQWQIPSYKVWIMPTGGSRKELLKTYSLIMDQTLERGYNFSSRNHIIAYDTQKLK